MKLKRSLICVLFAVTVAEALAADDQLIFNGFTGVNLSLDGAASLMPNGLIMLTHGARLLKGHAFLPSPFRFHAGDNGMAMRSFSATFVFAILGQYKEYSGHGIVFVVAPSTDFSTALPSQYLGILNTSSNGRPNNHLFAVELDTILNGIEFNDINDNHVGVDINSLKSTASSPAGYYADSDGAFHNLTLISGDVMQLWIDYDAGTANLDVTLAPVPTPRPKKPLLTTAVNLSTVIPDAAYVGFASSTGNVFSRHFVLAFSFAMDGTPAPAIDYSKLPALPRDETRTQSKILDVILPLAAAAFVLAGAVAVFALARRRTRYAELREDWETEFGPHRFAYKDLFKATDGFKDRRLLGIGGFGRVYRGVLPKSKIEVAVKKVSHESRQGMREFIAEVVSLGRMRHRNLVQLLGYCRRKGELLLVYDYMPNGSLDKYIHCGGTDKPVLPWPERLGIIRGVAAGLLYLHEDWEQVVIHRDIKASNVLLDCDLNARLGDFGLARLYDHGVDPKTTHVVGTIGYLAPELARTWKATPATDVFSFGAFMLEVVCGRRPVEEGDTGERELLVDAVLDRWRNGQLVDAVDGRLAECGFDGEEAELLLRVGLLCSHQLASVRPTMRQVVQYLEGSLPPPELSQRYLSLGTLALYQQEGSDGKVLSYPSSSAASLGSTTGLSGGR